MTDQMNTLSFESLARWILNEYETSRSIFGIHESLFFKPGSISGLQTKYLDRYLATPVGPAAGPHTQLAQNILCAWLSGGRFIELKTVQVMDDLDIPRPCIDMEDEGYNVEWSQELSLEQSADEYIKAWVLIYMLRRLLKFEDMPFGTIFNMSVGYDFDGIRSEPVTKFMDRLKDASEIVDVYRTVLNRMDSRFNDMDIPAQVTDNVTVSTMHGCPPDEIERIARYLLEERGLHTTVKLNPTLLGRDNVLNILHEKLGFREIEIPDSVFENDLQYSRALVLIRNLDETARRCGRVFGIKLSNTLAVKNHRDVLPGNDMYMSGRALFPVTVNLMQRIRSDLGPALNISFSAGADAFNIVDILVSGAFPVTVASDLLKPGGYSRMLQYVHLIRQAVEKRGGGGSVFDLADRTGEYLTDLAVSSLKSKRYQKSSRSPGRARVLSPLGFFDCIEAPCRSACAVNQNIPEYLAWIEKGDPDHASETILARNPLPGITGYVCTHRCRTHCTRLDYDEALSIRALKRYAVEFGKPRFPPPTNKQSRSVAVIGGGPSGLAAACYLRLNGIDVTIFEAADRLGGMIALAPSFRIPPDIIEMDIKRIIDLGITVKLEHPVLFSPEELLERGFDAIYIATGFRKDTRLDIEGMDGDGAWYALDFLDRLSRGEKPVSNGRMLVIGGGNTAMDAARAAQRLTGRAVTVVYRRSEKEMPAEREEVFDLLAEGNHLEQLVSPLKVIRHEGKIVGLKCIRNRLADPGPDGRPRPEPIRGTEFIIPADGIISAIGQRPDISMLENWGLRLKKNGAVYTENTAGQLAPRIFAGGDAVRGPSTVIQACADGMAAAEAISILCTGSFHLPSFTKPAVSKEDILRLKQKRAWRIPPISPPVTPPKRRNGFENIEGTYSSQQASTEAARCLQCQTLCDKCIDVCPNRANIGYDIMPVCVDMPVVVGRQKQIEVVRKEKFEVHQTRQIIHVDDFCNECGNCATFCVHIGKPYQDKPRLFLDEMHFRGEQNNAFFLPNQDTLLYRNAGETLKLARKNNRFEFDAPMLKAVFSTSLEVISIERKAVFHKPVSLRVAGEMWVLLNGLTSLPFIEAISVLK